VINCWFTVLEETFAVVFDVPRVCAVAILWVIGLSSFHAWCCCLWFVHIGDPFGWGLGLRRKLRWTEKSPQPIRARASGKLLKKSGWGNCWTACHRSQSLNPPKLPDQNDKSGLRSHWCGKSCLWLQVENGGTICGVIIYLTTLCDVSLGGHHAKHNGGFCCEFLRLLQGFILYFGDYLLVRFQKGHLL